MKKTVERILLILTAVLLLLSFCACKKAPDRGYETENAGGSGYGAGIRSGLYFDDFYFVTLGTARSDIELAVGSPHYSETGDASNVVYELENGDSIAMTYDKEKGTVREATYVYGDGSKKNLFKILVDVGVLDSVLDENGETVIDVDGESEKTPDGDEKTDETDDSGKTPSRPATQLPVQGEVFASGRYDLSIIKPVLSIGTPRGSVIASVGRPSYYYSQNFAPDGYIIDCYNLTDGSKLFLDYGYGRQNLRCAAVYKNGSYTSVLDSPWNVQVKPNGFTRPTVSKNTVGRLSKNMTPVSVYKLLGEPSWFEGNRGNYTDVFAMSDGGYAYLNFGTSHDKLISLSIKGADGVVTVVTLNK